MLACRDNRIEIVNYLLECNVNIDQKNNDGETAILIACQRGYTNIVKKLLGKGANRNEINNVIKIIWIFFDFKFNFIINFNRRDFNYQLLLGYQMMLK